MSVTPINEYPTDLDLQQMIRAREVFLEGWSVLARKAGIPQLWSVCPTINLQTGRIWNLVPSATANACFRDEAQAFIIGTGIDGLRYVRVVSVPIRAFHDGMAASILVDTLALVTIKGPSVCTLLVDGGDYPAVESQPSLGE